MDFVNRLKKFLELKSIPVTQFADNCRIPRPTLSQLLNGRNKKVSDEVIGKIHDAYPNLSVLWLMFGEGQMETSPASSSRPEKSTISDKGTDSSSSSPSYRFDEMFNLEDNEPSTKTETQSQTTIEFPEASAEREDESGNKTEDNKHEAPGTLKPPAGHSLSKIVSSAPTHSKKKIVNIIVYYDDNSFEAFVPENR